MFGGPSWFDDYDEDAARTIVLVYLTLPCRRIVEAIDGPHVLIEGSHPMRFDWAHSTFIVIEPTISDKDRSRFTVAMKALRLQPYVSPVLAPSLMLEHVQKNAGEVGRLINKTKGYSLTRKDKMHIHQYLQGENLLPGSDSDRLIRSQISKTLNGKSY